MPKTRWLSEPEQRAWLGYRRMRALLDLQIARDLETDSGLSEPDYDVLTTLTEAPSSRWRAGDLAERLLWSTSRLAHHVGRMEQRGLVAREPAVGDGRGAVVAITDHGWATLRAAAPLHVRSVRRYFVDLLTPAEIAMLEQIADRVVANLTPD